MKQPKIWAKADSLAKQQKLQAALDETQTILTEARKLNQENLIAEALVRTVRLQIGLHGYETAVRFLHEQQWPGQPLEKTLVELFFAHTLMEYFDAYSLEINKREKTVSTTTIDLKAWTKDQLSEKIIACFSAALTQEELMSQKIPDFYQPFFNSNNYPHKIRDVLRDAIVYIAVKHLANSHYWTPQQTNEVYKVNIKLLAAAPQQVRLAPGQYDSHPLEILASWLGEHIAFHQQHGRPAAALEAHYMLIEYLHSHAKDTGLKKELIKVLRQVQNKNIELQWWSKGQALLSELIQEQEEPGALIEARAEALLGAEAYPGSYGAARCVTNAEEIQQPAYRLRSMNLDGLQKKSISIRYKNITHLYFRAYALVLEIILNENIYSQPGLIRDPQRFINSPENVPVFTWSATLNPTPDYTFHHHLVAPEISKKGLYFVVASAKADFSESNNSLVGVTLLISDLVLMHQKPSNTLYEFKVLNGESGVAEPGTEVALYSYAWEKKAQLVQIQESDNDGAVQFTIAPAENTYLNYFVLAIKEESFSIQNDFFYHFREDSPELKQSLVFTDRAIYRPGQKILWKVVGYAGNRQSGKFHTAEEGTRLDVNLIDTNLQVVTQQSVSLNEYGTGSGEFTIPTGRLLGHWSIRVNPPFDGSNSLRVEEYKRPTFETSLTDALTDMRLNHRATVKGEAKYYFGQPVSGGKVSWRVLRRTHIPNWYWYCGWGAWWGINVNQAEQTIAQGTCAMNADGTFVIEFLPEADEQAANNHALSYNFHVQADVTDEGGETRSASRTYRAGWVTVEADFDITDSFVRSSEHINVTTKLTTLNGKALPGHARFKVIRLQQPLQTPLPAEIENTNIFDHRADLENFATPSDKQRERWNGVIDWEAIAVKWAEGEIVQTGALVHDREGKAEMRIPPVNNDGVYRVYYETTDAYGETFTMAKNFLAVSAQPTLNLPFLFFVDKTTAKVGESIQLFVYSGLRNQRFTLETYKYDKRIAKRQIDANQDHAFITLPIREEDRGGMSFRLCGVRDYQSMRQENVINVPWDNKELQVKFVSFRDKMRPGAMESLRILVQDYEGKTLPANMVEVLSYMYDRSLDMFGLHNVQSPLHASPRSGTNTQWGFNLFSQTGRSFSGYFFGPTDYPRLHEDDFAVIYNYGVGGPGARSVFKDFQFLCRTRSADPFEDPFDTEGAVVSSSSMAMEESGSMDTLPMSDVFEENTSLSKPDNADPFAGQPQKPEADGPQLRSNFSETAFFKPHLILDKDGTVGIEFQVPDSVTSWNVYAHAITKDFCGGSLQQQTQTVKELIVRPYIPRFLREGDEATIKVVVNNAGESDLVGEVTFDIQDPDSGLSLLEIFGLNSAQATTTFNAKLNNSDSISFKIKAPKQIGTYAFKVTATADNYSDGELRPFPVLPSRIHLAQSRFVTLNKTDKKIMRFPDLMDNSDSTRLNERMVVTVDGQLFFSVLSALPYLINFPYECVEQTFNRFFSTAVVQSIFDRFPSVANMAKEMSTRQTHVEGFVIDDPNRRMTLEESPWLQQAQGGAQQEKDLANVLDVRVVKDEKDKSLEKLAKMQLPSGGFPWFQGGPADKYMTLYLLMGMGKAFEFKIEIPKDMIIKAWRYTHDWLEEEFRYAMSVDCCWEYITMANFTVSLYPDDSWSDGLFTQIFREELLAFSFRHWQDHAPLLKGYLALTLKRMDRAEDAQLVWDSVMDSAQTNDELGTYWAKEDRSWLWYQDTIETHAFSIRTLLELNPSDSKLEGLVQWLFLNKKLNQWKSTKATAEAIYALAFYLEKTAALGTEERIQVDVGTQQLEYILDPNKYTGRNNQVVLAGTELDPEKNSQITVTKTTPGFAFASAVWHFSTEQLPTTEQGDFFFVRRKYYKRENTGKEWILKPLADGETITVGDQLEIHISLKTKHEAEYVHLRDPRAAGFEPENVQSGYRWDGGISWYEEIRDSGTNFFFSKLPVGEYNFKYRLRANMAGAFRIGPATVQSMYAPEFNAYSAGDRLVIQ